MLSGCSRHSPLTDMLSFILHWHALIYLTLTCSPTTGDTHLTLTCSSAAIDTHLSLTCSHSPHTDMLTESHFSYSCLREVGASFPHNIGSTFQHFCKVSEAELLRKYDHLLPNSFVPEDVPPGSGETLKFRHSFPKKKEKNKERERVDSIL